MGHSAAFEHGSSWRWVVVCAFLLLVLGVALWIH